MADAGYGDVGLSMVSFKLAHWTRCTCALYSRNQDHFVRYFQKKSVIQKSFIAIVTIANYVTYPISSE